MENIAAQLGPYLTPQYVGIVILLMLFFLVYQSIDSAPKEKSAPPYKARRLMTSTQQDFFQLLVSAVPEGIKVFPQVSLTAVLESAASTPSAIRAAKRRIAEAQTGYVIWEERTNTVKALVDLDAETGGSAAVAYAEAARAAGIPILAFESAARPGVQDIKSALSPYLAFETASVAQQAAS